MSVGGTSLRMRRAKGHPDPHVKHPKNFANNVEHVRGGAPPVHWVEWIVLRCADEDASAAVCVFVPESVNPAGVSLGGDDYHGCGVLFFGFGCYGVDFVNGVGDRWRKGVNVRGGNAAMLQDLCVESVFAGSVDIERRERCGRLIRMR